MAVSDKGQSLHQSVGIDSLIARGVPLHQIEQWLDQLEFEQARQQATKAPRNAIYPANKGQRVHPACRYDFRW